MKLLLLGTALLFPIAASASEGAIMSSASSLSQKWAACAGLYSHLKAKKNQQFEGFPVSDKEVLIIYPVPSLVATLVNRERTKGSPLTEEEVLQIRDNLEAIAVPPDVARKMDESRGYLDINPENCWDEWQQARKELMGI